MPTWLLWTLGLGVPLAAASVPIIIHLINLTRYRRVEWAAMEFLLNAYKRTRRRMQMENLIMLLLRVCAVILLAAALFPMGCQKMRDAIGGDFSGGAILNNDAPMHLLMILDDSASMAYESQDETSLSRAKVYALSVVDALDQARDRVSVIRLSDVHVPPRAGGGVVTAQDEAQSRRSRLDKASFLSVSDARRLISNTELSAVDTNILAAMREAARLADATPQSDALGLLVISDYHLAGWGEVRKDGPVNAEFVQSVQRIQPRLEKSGTQALFFDSGLEKPENFAITNIRVEERVIGNGMEATLLVDVARFGDAGEGQRRPVRLRYRINGGQERPVGTTVQLAPGESATSIQVKVPARELALKEDEAATGASRNIEIYTDDADPLRSDNARNLVLHVVPNVPILVVNGVAHPDPDLDETFYLETALGISSNRGEGDRGDGEVVNITPNRITTLEPKQLDTKMTFLEYRLVILANVKSLPAGVVENLEAFVRAGYSLLVFDGDQVDAQSYNAQLYKDGKGLLPARLAAPGGLDDRGAEHYSLAVQDRTHPVIALFADSEENLSIITDPKVIRNWRTLKLPEGVEVDPLRPTNVLLNLNLPGGPQPLVLERSFDRGKVVYVGTTAGERWNMLWRSNGLPLFLYLEMAAYLTSNEARYSNLRVGEPYRRVLRGNEVAPVFTIRDPSKVSAELQPTELTGPSTGASVPVNMIEFGGTTQPGVYTLSAMERDDKGALRLKWSERFAVNMDTRESDVTKLALAEGGTEAALREALPDVPFAFARASTRGEDGQADFIDPKDDQLWMWLALAAAVFFTLEIIWSGVISKPEQ